MINQAQQQAETESRGTLHQMMNRSTIYDRHEERRMRTIQNRDDPRPAVIRVLAGLPGFRVVIPPYQRQQNQPVLQSDSVVLFTDPTIFINSDATSTYNNDAAMPKNTVMNSSKSASMAFATGAVAAAALLKKNIRPVPQTSSLFSSVRTTSTMPISASAIPMFQTSNSAAVAFLKPAAHHHYHATSNAVLSAPVVRSVVFVSFLAFVGYKNILHQQRMSNIAACSDE